MKVWHSHFTLLQLSIFEQNSQWLPLIWPSLGAVQVHWLVGSREVYLPWAENDLKCSDVINAHGLVNIKLEFLKYGDATIKGI